jgi:diaminohydroxyphosphoribosylaminopyrimidine deaminase / 5-amino-6-(5-phosphoribosylamino)uracil reductase
VITTAAAPERATSAWLAVGAKVQTVPVAPRGGVDLAAALELLGGLGVVQALVEGGAQLAGALLDAGLVDRLVTYVAPLVLGAAATPAFGTTGPPTLAAADRLQLAGATRLGDDVRLEYERPHGRQP